MGILGSRRRVAHFVRKNTQFKASFIRNQVTTHKQYEPVLIWRKEHSKLYDGGYADFDPTVYSRLELNQEERWLEKVLFRGPKTLSARHVDKVLGFLETKEVNVCHFHYGSDCGIFFPLLKKLNIPSVVSFYGYDCSSFPSQYLGLGKLYLQNRVFKDISAVLAMSPDMKRDLIGAGCPEEKIIVHYYGTDCSRFLMKRVYAKKKELRLLMVANLEPKKGHEFLFRSLMRLRESGRTDWTLRIVGVGPSEKALKDFAVQTGLTENVVFVGGVKYGGTAMMKEYQLADIFVHPSVTTTNGEKEGIPGTIIEAMAAGLPVVSTSHAGIPYIIENEQTGLLCGEWDVDHLALYLTLLIEETDLRRRLGEAAQTYAMKHLDLNEKEKELELIYGKLTGRTEYAYLPA